MIFRTCMAAVALAAAGPAMATVTIGTQIVDTRLTGTIANAPADSADSDAAAGAGRVSAQAQLVEQGTGFPLLRATSIVTAELSGAERGRVTFRRTLTPGGSDSGNAVASSSANYRYFFATDTPVAFDVNWGVATFGWASDGRMPAQNLLLSTRGGGDALLRLDALGDGASGTQRLTLDPGSYELRIEDAFGALAPAGTSSGLSSQYSFALRVVPEPATWTMLIVGFGLVGAMLRWRRRGAAAAA